LSLPDSIASAPSATSLHRRVASRIREVARQRKIRITHLPDRAGVSRSHFREIMACRKSPTLTWLKKVADALMLA
jgi:hypothetical protein